MEENFIEVYDENSRLLKTNSRRRLRTEEELELLQARSYKIVKANDIIQKVRFELSAQKQKIVLYIISKIKPEDEDFMYQKFTIKEFCNICGIEGSGKDYINVKKAIKELADESVWLNLDNETEVIVRWIEKAWIEKNSGIVIVRLDNDMKPYLLKLSQFFTQYEMYYILPMRSQYSIRMYELMKSYENKRQIEFNIEDLKRILSAVKYDRYRDFRKNVLEISMREINYFTDLSISYKTIKEGRKNNKIKFFIRLKRDINERCIAWDRIEEALGADNRMEEDIIYKLENEGG